MCYNLFLGLLRFGHLCIMRMYFYIIYLFTGFVVNNLINCFKMGCMIRKLRLLLDYLYFY